MFSRNPQANVEVVASIEQAFVTSRARAAALNEERIRPHLEGKTVKKFIYVKGKIASFIVT